MDNYGYQILTLLEVIAVMDKSLKTFHRTLKSLEICSENNCIAGGPPFGLDQILWEQAVAAMKTKPEYSACD